MYNHREKTNYYDRTKKVAYDSQIVRTKENLKLGHGGTSQIHVSGSKPLIEVLDQGFH